MHHRPPIPCERLRYPALGTTRSPEQFVILATFKHLQINDVLCDQVKTKQRREAAHRTDCAKCDGPFDQ
jgi:hypothetical protein